MIRLKCSIVLLYLFVTGFAFGKECRTDKILTENPCGSNAICRELRQNSHDGECVCMDGYAMNGTVCLAAISPTDEGSHWGISIFLILALLLFVIAAVFYCRKYRIIGWLRYKINQRYNSNYDDVMIGQDDD